MSSNSDNADIAMLASRRGLLRNTALGAAALGAATIGLTQRGEAEEAAAITDADILNFALNLEYLEAEFYYYAVYGYGLPASAVTGTGTLGPVMGGTKVNFTEKNSFALAREIANDEYNHVLFLRKALGSAAVARPAINLTTSFAAVGQASGAYPAGGPAFNPYAGDDAFLLGAFIFEDVGVTAYSGAAPLIKNKAYLAAAAGILAVEAYHAAELRTRLLIRGYPYGSYADMISALRADLSNAQDDQGPTVNNVPNIVPTDSNSLAFARTPAQVLNIVYGGGSSSNYLFFPNKMNGTIS